MSDSCCSQPSAGATVCELPSPKVERPPRVATFCPVCGQKGKPVQGQTVQAHLAVTLRQMQIEDYMFCGTSTCPVVYFSSDNKQIFTVEQIRERVYQKEPRADLVPVCYCFRHTLGEIRAASSEQRKAILDDINTGIQADQCACDLRNPQGSCCLGNVRELIGQLERQAEIRQRGST